MKRGIIWAQEFGRVLPARDPRLDKRNKRDIHVLSLKPTGRKRAGDDAPEYDMKIRFTGLKPEVADAKLMLRTEDRGDVALSTKNPIGQNGAGSLAASGIFPKISPNFC